MTPWQCKAAREYLELSRTELAEKTELSLPTLNNVEGGQKVRKSTLKAIEEYFNSKGIEFTETRTQYGVHVPVDKISKRSS